VPPSGATSWPERLEERPISSHLIAALSIPLFSGVIGYVTNWTGVWMLFNPLKFKGFRLPGLQSLAQLLPRKIQQVPGIMHGAVGWQGIIPSRAAKMGSIATDKGIAKIGSARDFYEQLDPEVLAQHILDSSRGDIRELVDRVLERENPRLWRDLPPRAREALHERVQRQLPDVVDDVTDQIGKNIDQLLDVKLMVIRHNEERPELSNRIFQEVGHKELKLIINLGFVFGLILGIPVVFLTEAFPYWWVLPIAGSAVGYITNYVAIWMIFEPAEPKKIGPFTLHGLFLRRQHQAAEVYGQIISEDIITIENIGTELLHGPRSDRTRLMIANALRPAIDRATGSMRPAVRAAVGAREYDAMKDSIAEEGVEYTMTPLTDKDFNREQSGKIRELITDRMRKLSPKDFSEMMRSAMKEDEWLLFLHGAVLGIGAGLLHLAIFGV